MNTFLLKKHKSDDLLEKSVPRVTRAWESLESSCAVQIVIFKPRKDGNEDKCVFEMHTAWAPCVGSPG